MRELLEAYARVLFLVGEDQLGAQPRHGVHVDVLGSADQGHRPGGVAVSSSPEEAVAGPARARSGSRWAPARRCGGGGAGGTAPAGRRGGARGGGGGGP